MRCLTHSICPQPGCSHRSGEPGCSSLFFYPTLVRNKQGGLEKAAGDCPVKATHRTLRRAHERKLIFWGKKTLTLIAGDAPASALPPLPPVPAHGKYLGCWGDFCSGHHKARGGLGAAPLPPEQRPGESIHLPHPREGWAGGTGPRGEGGNRERDGEKEGRGK